MGKGMNLESRMGAPDRILENLSEEMTLESRYWPVKPVGDWGEVMTMMGRESEPSSKGSGLHKGSQRSTGRCPGAGRGSAGDLRCAASFCVNPSTSSSLTL